LAEFWFHRLGADMNDINREMAAEVRKLRRLVLWLIFALLISAAALTDAYWRVAHQSAPAAGATGRQQVPPLPSSAIPGAVDKSIAVLPFQKLSGDQEISHIADDVREQVLSKLTKIDDLKIISPSNAMQHQANSTRSAGEVGQQLGAVYLLEGSVWRADHHLVMHVQLIDAARDNTIWEETYDRELPMHSL
jgi:TolB-like protein